MTAVVSYLVDPLDFRHIGHSVGSVFVLVGLNLCLENKQTVLESGR